MTSALIDAIDKCKATLYDLVPNSKDGVTQ